LLSGAQDKAGARLRLQKYDVTLSLTRRASREIAVGFKMFAKAKISGLQAMLLP
jgi:hypothetical protein